MNKSEKIISSLNNLLEDTTLPGAKTVISPKPDMSKVNNALKKPLGQAKQNLQKSVSFDLVPTPDSSPLGLGGTQDYETETGDTMGVS